MVLSVSRSKLLKPFGKHAVFPDRDSPRGWDLVTRMVSGLDKSVELILPPVGKDPGDCDCWQVVDCYAQSQRYSDWEVDNFISNVTQATGMATRLNKR